MTRKPTEEGDIVEIDAMDESEWEKDAHTPIVEDEQLSKLVRQSSDKSAPVAVPVPVGSVASRPVAATVKRAPTPAPAKTPPPTPIKPTKPIAAQAPPKPTAPAQATAADA